MYIRNFVIITYSSVALAATDISFLFVNNCSEKIWPSLTGNESQIPDPLPVGLSLSSGEHHISLPIVAPWSGRAWARQGCAPDGTQCQVGDCKSPSCWGTSSQNTTLFEITMRLDGTTVYDISLVNGLTLAMEVSTPLKDCKTVKCNAPPYLGFYGATGTLQCPANNIWLSDGTSALSHCIADVKQVIGCKSDCTVYGTDEACCLGQFNTSTTCMPSSSFFKAVCPEVYSYAFDDPSATNYCDNVRNMTITFCPG